MSTSWMSSRFIEASIAYYRGKPIMTDGDYKELRAMPALAELLNENMLCDYLPQIPHYFVLR